MTNKQKNWGVSRLETARDWPGDYQGLVPTECLECRMRGRYPNHNNLFALALQAASLAGYKARHCKMNGTDRSKTLETTSTNESFA